MKLYVYACISFTFFTSSCHAMQSNMADQTTHDYNHSVHTINQRTNTVSNSTNFGFSWAWTCSDDQKKIVKTCFIVGCSAVVVIAGIYGYKKLKPLFGDDDLSNSYKINSNID
ncbi:hypothetical protein Noda2021_07820 [Candidatus Dependentiae bacterium Noda2021]|nr:hypothetical protein Noda2021_07820 [Candidatus Dependentiae bacterium Noda2021]